MARAPSDLLHEVRRVWAKTCEVQMTREQHQWRHDNRNTTTTDTTSTKLRPHPFKSASHAALSFLFSYFQSHSLSISIGSHFYSEERVKTVEKTAPSCCSKRRAPATVLQQSRRHTSIRSIGGQAPRAR